jgi:hypothetical protein
LEFQSVRCAWQKTVLERSASASIASDELTNKQRNWYRIRVFGDDRHRDDLYNKDIRRAYWFYAKVETSRADRTGRPKKSSLPYPQGQSGHSLNSPRYRSLLRGDKGKGGGPEGVSTSHRKERSREQGEDFGAKTITYWTAGEGA